MSFSFSGLSSWEDFQRALHPLDEKSKGDAFELLVKCYLQIDTTYVSKLKHVWLFPEIPNNISKRLNLPSTDQGIDLVAETHEGELWAIQCKYREDPTHTVPWRELSTFKGLASLCKSFAFELVCSSTERITHILENQDKIGFCSLDTWLELDADFFTRAALLLEGKVKKIAPATPRPHQQAAIKDAVSHYVDNREKRGKLIMPCGTGKSLTAYWIAEKLDVRTILIAVPSLALIRQTLKVWLRESVANNREVNWICVCSDESAGRVEQDDVAVLRQDIGVPCLTNPEEISAWFDEPKSGLTVVFTTYQSGEAIAKAAKQAQLHFDLGIMDEAHKTVGAKDKLFSHLLFDKNLPIARRIFMTATERRYRGDSDEILSMCNPGIYGETFHLLTFKQALEYDPPILSDYKILTTLVSRDEVAELIRNNAFVRPDKGEWDSEIEAEMLASMVALRKAMVKYPIHHAVTFHGSIRKASVFRDHNDTFTQTFPSYGDVVAFHVSGQTPTGTRARIVKEFAGVERGIITNAKCLTEGVDVPNIDCVLFADPRRSTVDIVQAVGRALRPAAGKEMGYVILPILHAPDASAGDIIQSGEFQEVLATLRALASNDDRIIEYFRSVSQGRQKATGGGSVVFDLDERLAAHINLEEFAREIDLKCWDRLAQLSWRPFEEAREFVQRLELKNQGEWRTFCKRKMSNKEQLPKDIPVAPEQVYRDKGWNGYGDWLGTGTIAPFLRVYRPFLKARAFVHSLKLKNRDEWFLFCKGELSSKGVLPSDIPSNPNNTYADEWKGMGDWLGTGRIATHLRKYRPFPEARKYARSLKLKNITEWNDFCKGKMPNKGDLPDDIPAFPNKVYKDNGWSGVGDWLGTGNIANFLREYRPFLAARDFVRALKLKNRVQWHAFCSGELSDKGQLPDDIPMYPNRTYAKEWKGMGDWLGTGNIANFQKEFRPFADARTFVRKLKLKSQNEWVVFCKGEMPEKGQLPTDIPTNPNKSYAKDGWKNMGDWLGTGTIATYNKIYRSFHEARSFVRKLELKNNKEWRVYCKGEMPGKRTKPDDIPSSPEKTYANKGWSGYGDWLGNRIE